MVFFGYKSAYLANLVKQDAISKIVICIIFKMLMLLVNISMSWKIVCLIVMCESYPAKLKTNTEIFINGREVESFKDSINDSGVFFNVEIH